MYLELIPNEARSVFLDLAYQAMECDGDIAREEKEVIKSYVNECCLHAYKRSKRTIQQNCEALLSFPMKVRKVVLLELCGVWAADDKWRASEIDMFTAVAARLGIAEMDANRIRRWSSGFRDVIREGYMHIST